MFLLTPLSRTSCHCVPLIAKIKAGSPAAFRYKISFMIGFSPQEIKINQNNHSIQICEDISLLSLNK